MIRAEQSLSSLTAEVALAFLRYLVFIANLQDVHFLWRPVLRDPDEDMVLEGAAPSRQCNRRLWLRARCCTAGRHAAASQILERRRRWRLRVSQQHYKDHNEI